MSLSISGSIHQILPVESGESKAGKVWKKQSFVINNGDQYNPYICFSLFGDEKISLLAKFEVGKQVEVFFNLSSREFNTKWYHNVDAWRITTKDSNSESTIPSDSIPIPNEVAPAVEEDDLPF